jgi:CDP-glycerol glycerophosphotransferase
VLLHEQERLEVSLPRDDDGFTLELPRLTRFGRQVTFRGGTWNLLAIDAQGRAWTLASAAPVNVRLPDTEAGATYVLKHDRGGVNLLVESRVPGSDRSAISQDVISSMAWRRAAAGRRARAVLYECYFGRSVGCHPRALFERLRHDLPGDVEHVFVTEPGFLHAPEGARTVLRRSREYYDLLASAPLVVTNCDLIRSFERG